MEDDDPNVLTWSEMVDAIGEGQFDLGLTGFSQTPSRFEKVHFKISGCSTSYTITEWMEWMSHRKRKETKQQPGPAGPGSILGCCLFSLSFLCDLHSIHYVQIVT